MLNLEQTLKLNRCPHCSIDKPNLNMHFSEFHTHSDDGSFERRWRIYICARCGGVVSAFAVGGHSAVLQTYPEAYSLNEVLPLKVKAFLQQAIDSLFAPSGSVMLCASAVDAMLKDKGYKKGSLYSRIDLAVNDGLMTPGMARWAHQIRLDANDERHVEDESILPTTEDAKRSVEFTKTLAEFLFVLPSKVTRGIKDSSPSRMEK